MQTTQLSEWIQTSEIMISLAVISLLLAGFFLLRKKKPAKLAPEKIPEEVVVKPATKTELSWEQRLFKGMSKTRSEIWNKVESLLGKNELDAKTIEEMEELLYTADLGPALVEDLLQALKQHKSTDGQDKRQVIYNFLKAKFDVIQPTVANELFESSGDYKKPYVIMIVGVNGAGKTTTIGKLATRLTRQGAKVVVGACDTFRAAAVDQLQVWCDRAGASMVRAKENSAPSGVGYQALEQAVREKADYCLLDTAGRLHTKEDLMLELEKSKRVLSKLVPDAPHQVLLVLDAIAGQNSLRQAQEFNKALGLTGLIFTKCDGSSKAGSAVAIVEQLKVPITYIGVGEGVEDLDRFESQAYLNALLNMPVSTASTPYISN